MIEWLPVGLAGYLIGSFPSAIVVSRIWRGIDLRDRGSGNPGALNALRVLGPLPGALVFCLDIGKGFAAAALPSIWPGPVYGWLGGLAAVIGHIFPVYAGFRGGKGLATSCGAVAYLAPWSLAVFAPLWGVFFLWRRRMAPASIAAYLGVGIWAFLALPPWRACAVAAGCALIIWRHWAEARAALFGPRATETVTQTSRLAGEGKKRT